MVRKQRIQPRFRTGERVVITSSIRSRLAGKHAVVRKVMENRHSQTLDKYAIQVEDADEQLVVWDIELKAEN